ncbi:MAG TPA: aldo/keto reductase [Verrucomicrobiae bacterium]|nr:aldo/keto reductase [Verrucomicrobiae bacterium]
MNFRELGKTGVKISEVGIGLWEYHSGPELLRKAIDMGATFIDTAELFEDPVPGQVEAEQVVGQAIKGVRDKVFVANKTNHWRRADVFKSCETSLKNLGIDCIDLYSVHWPNAKTPMEETIGAMEELAEQGKVRFLGVSNFSIGEMKRAQAALRKHQIVSTQLRYNLIDRTIETRLLPYCREMGVTVIGFSPLGHSFQRILERDPEDALGKVARETGKSKAQVALKWCLRQPGLVTIPKTNSETHMAENCSVSEWQLTPEQISLLDKKVLFRRRSAVEAAVRRSARGFFQVLNLDFNTRNLKVRVVRR